MPQVVLVALLGAAVLCLTIGARYRSRGAASRLRDDQPPPELYDCELPVPPTREDPPACTETLFTHLFRAKFEEMRASIVNISAAFPPRDNSAHTAWRARHGQLRGVNVGGWLLLERWLVGKDPTVETRCCGAVQSPFDGTTWETAPDELSLTRWLRANGELSRISAFRDTYISRVDFALMRCLGLNAVRIPFGYWLATPPGVDDVDGFFPGRGLEYLDRALGWASDFGLKVVLDLHGAPGGQSGAMTCGQEDRNWAPERFGVDATVSVLGRIAARYAGNPAVIGIELLNEPTLPRELALSVYGRAIAAVRGAGMAAEDVAIVINLYGFGELSVEGSVWQGLLSEGGLPPAENLIIDLHLYYNTLPRVFALVPLCYVTSELVDAQSRLLSLLGLPTMVGEWSLRLPWQGELARQFEAMTAPQQDAFLAAFARRQVEGMAAANASSVGGFYWTWTAPETEAQWSLLRVLQNSWLVPGAWTRAREAGVVLPRR